MTDYQLRFIKPCRESDSSPPLSVKRVKENKARNTETSLLLDLNILIRMEDVLLRGGDPNEFKLTELINFINTCPEESICLTPGFALNEVHPKFKNQCFGVYETFLSFFCPQMIDHPASTRHSETIVSNTRRKRFEELPIGEQYIHSVSYYSLIQIHIIDSSYPNLSPIDKFNKYMESVCKDIDLLSALEAEIAKYCFCEKKGNYSQGFKVKIQGIKDNFLNRNGRGEQRLMNIFNGVQDLKYIKSALLFSEEEFYGKNQETWIVTLDSKLYWLSESIHYFPVDGEPHSKYYCTVRTDEQNSCPYWQAVDDAFISLQEKRKLLGKGGDQPFKDGRVNELHTILITKGFEDFASAFT